MKHSSHGSNFTDEGEKFVSNLIEQQCRRLNRIVRKHTKIPCLAQWTSVETFFSSSHQVGKKKAILKQKNKYFGMRPCRWTKSILFKNTQPLFGFYSWILFTSVPMNKWQKYDKFIIYFYWLFFTSNLFFFY